jgi:radical SAM protein with 4Fe4S-binding SPASM domain
MSSTCEQLTGLEDKPFWEAFARNLTGQRVPFSGSLALTNRCNLRCLHCYAVEKKHAPPKPELTTAQWQRIIGEIRDAGCLNLLLTGGEPLCREDFAEIYSFVKRNGFLVTVFTNATLVSDAIVALFDELPPRLVEVSLYGASAAIHDRITGKPGSFKKAMQGIEKMIAQGIHVGLKSVLMKQNLDGFSAIGDLARSFNVKFRIDASIFPTMAGDLKPIELRVAPEQAVALEMANPERAREWREYFEKYRIVAYGKRVFACSAGLTHFHVDPDGSLFPCLIARSYRYSLRQDNFKDGWNGEIARIRDLEAGADFPCSGCEKKLICGFCPGFFELENGESRRPSDYVCAIGHLRYNYITTGQVGG